MKIFFNVICLKRTVDPNLKVYWKPHRAGYTTDLDNAGVYDSDGLNKCAGDPGIDWDVCIAPLGKMPDECDHLGNGEPYARGWKCGCSECLLCGEFDFECESDACQAHTRDWEWF